MTDKLLYYPYINIPKTAWTIQSLLYWDKVAIIVPEHYEICPSFHDRFTTQLLQEGLIIHENPVDAYSFMDDFLNILNSPFFNLKEKRDNFLPDHCSKIYEGKFEIPIIQMLIEEGLAKKTSGGIFVEEYTANLMMSNLAARIAKSRGYTPATDNIVNMPSVNMGNEFSMRRHEMRQSIIEEVMPYPCIHEINDSYIIKIMQFKERYGDELKSFRIFIEEEAVKISGVPDQLIRDEMKNILIEKIDHRKSIIEARLKEFDSWNVKLGGILKFLFSIRSAIIDHFFGIEPDVAYRDTIQMDECSYLALLSHNGFF